MQNAPNPLIGLLKSRAVLIAALAFLLTVAGAVACPDGLEAETCDKRVPVILESFNLFALAVIAKMGAEDVAAKIGAGLSARANLQYLGGPYSPPPQVPTLHDPTAARRKH